MPKGAVEGGAQAKTDNLRGAQWKRFSSGEAIAAAPADEARKTIAVASALMARLERLLRFDTIDSPELRIRLRAAWLVGALFIGIHTLNMGVAGVNYGRWTFDHTIMAATCISVIPVIALLRWYKNILFYTVAYSAVFFLATTASAMADHGGINTALLPFFPLGPVFACIVAGRRAAYFFFVVAVADLALLYWDSITNPSIMLSGGYTRETNRFALALFALAMSTAIAVLVVERFNTLQRDLRREKEFAEEAAKARNMFLAMISHEFLTPISTIISITQLLEKKEERIPFIDEIQTINAAGETLLGLVNNALDYAREHSGSPAPHYAPLEFDSLLGGILRVLSPRINAKGLSVRAVYAPAFPSVIVGDAGLLRQLLVNILGNAVKFTECGEIVVRAEAPREGGALRVEVRDSGPGVAQEMREAIFEPFHRGAAPPGVEGVGLGLAICERIVASLGGEIGVESETGVGATFWFEIPLPRAGLGAGMENAAAQRRKLTILLVEDHAYNQRVLKEILELDGQAVIAVAGCAEALSRLREQSVDLILTDLYLEDGSGAEMASMLRARGVKIPIIALTASPETYDIARCRSAGIDEVLAKPFSLSAFRFAASRLMT